VGFGALLENGRSRSDDVHVSVSLWSDIGSLLVDGGAGRDVGGMMAALLRHSRFTSSLWNSIGRLVAGCCGRLKLRLRLVSPDIKSPKSLLNSIWRRNLHWIPLSIHSPQSTRYPRLRPRPHTPKQEYPCMCYHLWTGQVGEGVGGRAGGVAGGEDACVSFVEVKYGVFADMLLVR